MWGGVCNVQVISILSRFLSHCPVNVLLSTHLPIMLISMYCLKSSCFPYCCICCMPYYLQLRIMLCAVILIDNASIFLYITLVQAFVRATSKAINYCKILNLTDFLSIKL